MDKAVRSHRYQKYRSGNRESLETGIISEKPVDLTLNAHVWLTFMCTPTDLEALAIGFLYNENIIQSMSDVHSVRVCPGSDNVDVWLTHKVEHPSHWKRTSGCTGGISSVLENFKPQINPNGIMHSPASICRLSDQFLNTQYLYKLVGGVHSSALSDGNDIIVLAEDIGRHNTLDKLAGHCLLEHIELPSCILLTTGRLSSEMVQKAARIGSSIVISRTSPSSLSIELAHRWGITLIGYARRDSFNIYTHPNRIINEPDLVESTPGFIPNQES